MKNLLIIILLLGIIAFWSVTYKVVKVKHETWMFMHGVGWGYQKRIVNGDVLVFGVDTVTFMKTNEDDVDYPRPVDQPKAQNMYHVPFIQFEDEIPTVDEIKHPL